MKINIIDNHFQAYTIWKKLKIENRVLFHFDAHHDFDINYVSTKRTEHIGSGNYLHKATKDNMFNKIYWIIPGTKATFVSNQLKILQLLHQIKSKEPKFFNRIILEKNNIKTSINNTSFIVTTIDSLLNINDRVILDIDLDYFVIPNINKAASTQNIGKRKIWLSIDRFKKIIDKKGIKYDSITIAYSVNGGWTPMKYKYYGNILAKKFGLNNKNNNQKIIAGKCFRKFYLYYKMNKLVLAKKYYKMAIRLNPNYYSLYNNYGLLYLKSKRIKEAKYEFKKMLKIDSNYYWSYIGLGLCNLVDKNFLTAINMFKKAQKNSNNPDVLDYLFLSYFLSNKFQFLNKLIKKDDKKKGSVLMNVFKKINQINNLSSKKKEYLKTTDINQTGMLFELLDLTYK